LPRTWIIVVLLPGKEAILMGRNQRKKGRRQLGLFQPKAQIPQWRGLPETQRRDLKRLIGLMIREVWLAEAAERRGREVGDE
jgi:hypothetical protein